MMIFEHMNEKLKYKIKMVELSTTERKQNTETKFTKQNDIYKKNKQNKFDKTINMI